jgi:hypothetical protein
MKRISFFILFIALSIVSSLTVAGQKPDFSGTWKLDRTKTQYTSDFPLLVMLTVNLKGDSLLTERFYDVGDGQEYPFIENVTLNGEEYNIYIYDMDRKSKASWLEKEGSLLFESVTTAYGYNGAEDFKSKEIWKLDKTNNILTISYVNNTTAGETTGDLIFNKTDGAN